MRTTQYRHRAIYLLVTGGPALFLRKNVLLVLLLALGITIVLTIFGLTLLTPSQYDLFATGISIFAIVVSVIIWALRRVRK